MSSLIIEPHYLGSLEYFSLICQYKSLILEVNDRFQKQTYRNRCYVLGANGIQCLSIPVKYSNKSITKDVTIDHQQSWKKDHWGAFYSAYGKAPYFEHFSDSIREVWDHKHHFLTDLCREFIVLVLKLLQLDANVTYTEKYDVAYKNDFRNVIIPKKPFTSRNIYASSPYSQLFGDSFVSNLSILDLLLCEGPRAGQILSASFLSSSPPRDAFSSS